MTTNLNSPAPATKRFGANLRTARLAAGLTQDQLAKILGFQRATAISLWELSTTLPEPKTIRRLAAALGTSTDVLMHSVVTDYDLLRGNSLALSLDEVLALEAPTLDDDDAELLECYHYFNAATRATFLKLFKEMTADARGLASDARFQEERHTRARAQAAATLAPTLPRRRRKR